MKRRWATVGVALSVSWAVAAGAQVRGTIFGPGARSYPVAIAAPKRLVAGSTGQGIAARFADIVARDLKLSGYFEVLDRATYIEPPQTSGYTVDTINFDNWSVIGALGLVKGAFTVDGDRLSLEARLFDVYQRRQLTGRRYHGSITEVGRMAHRFADEIMAQFTGERGPFDSRIAFVSTRNGRFKEIYVMSLDGEDVRQVTKNQTINLAPSWSPDSGSLLFTSYQRGNPDLYAFNLLDGRETRLLHRAGLNLGGEYPADASKIAVTVEHQGNTEIVVVNRDGQVLQRLTNSWAIDVSPSWSPDGQQVAFCSNRSGTPQIYVTSAAGGDARRVTFSGDYNTSPAWSPTHDRIAYVSRAAGAFNIFTVSVDGSDVRQLTQGSGDSEDPSWSPDGRYLVFSSSRAGRRKLFVTDRNGWSQVQLTHGEGDDTSPAWSRWLE